MENIKGRNLLYKARVGSYLYGTETPESDEDFLGVFLPLPEDYLGLERIDDIDSSTKGSEAQRRNTAEDIDDKYYSLPKFLKLLLQNNPNIVELLFVNKKNIVYIDPRIQPILDHPEWFISQKVKHTFSGYAYSQRQKLIAKKERFEGLQKALHYLDRGLSRTYFIQDAMTVSMAYDLNSMVKHYKGQKGNTESFHKGLSLKMVYDHLKKEYEKYGWRVHTDSFEKVGYDVKFGYHLIRLLSEGYDLLSNGVLQFPLSQVLLDYINDIRSCKISYEDLLSKCDDLMGAVEEVAKKTTSLPVKPSWNKVNSWLIDTNLSNICEGQKE